MKPEIAIIGGGYAGLACAVTLARADVRVTVFESSRVLGGRARVVEKDGSRIDNGQHIMIGAYSQTLQLMRQVGVSPKWLETRPLTMHYPGRMHLKAANLPSPLHLAVGLLRASGLDWKDRFAAARLIRYLKKRKWQLGADKPVTNLLLDAGQTPRLRELLWEPLCIAALNTPPRRASAQVFANVLRDSLGAGASASELLLPRVDLSELFPVPAARWLAMHGHRVSTLDQIKGIRIEDGVFWLDGGPKWAGFHDVVIATAPYHALPLIEPFPELARLRQQIEALEYEPILTTYLAYDESVRLPEPMIGMSGGHIQWLFDRAQFGGPPGLLAAVISAHGPHEALDKAELEVLIQEEIHTLLGRLPPPQWIKTIVEKRATFACTPGLDRPSHRTAVPGLWLAGDYVAGDYPATLEGATRSGVRTALAVLGAL